MRNVLACLLVISIMMTSCGGSSVDKAAQRMRLYKITGATMGTTYHITSSLVNLGELQNDIDQLLVDINHEVSTYEEDSYISLFNKVSIKALLQNTSNAELNYPHFIENYDTAKEVFESTNGFFDPTVMPLVNYWGFGPNKKNPEQVDSIEIERIKKNIGFEKIKKTIYPKVSEQYLVKERPGLQLDFSALAKGYAVDKVAELLSEAGSENHLVEIGGEVKVKGGNLKSDFWTIGINKPTIDSKLNSIYKRAKLTDIAMASSGNYRNYFKIGEKIYSHTMNPKTGYPERNEILSVTVLAPDCITADAYATACMTMGMTEALKIINAQKRIEAFFIYTDDKGHMAELLTDGASSYIVN